MNLNDGEEDSFFHQRCLELAKLLRSEQTEDFLHLYDSLPTEWNGPRLETAKERIRQLQELDENEFELIYQRIFPYKETQQGEQSYSTILMSKSSVTHNEREQANDLLTSPRIIQQKQALEKPAVSHFPCDEQQHDTLSKMSTLLKNNDDTNIKSRRLQSITNNNNNNNSHTMIQNNCCTRTPVDSFVQLNLKPSIDITVEDYKKTRSPMSTSKTGNNNNRQCSFETTVSSTNILKKNKTSAKNKTHEEESFDYFEKMNEDDEEHSRSSSSSPATTNRFTISSNNRNDLTVNQAYSQSKSYEHSKLIPNTDFDSHGSSIATKSSSENSGSTRNGSASDSDDEQRKTNYLLTKTSSLLPKTKSLNEDNTPTILLNKTSDYPASQRDLVLSLPQQDSYELVQTNVNDESHFRVGQVPRFKQAATDDPNGVSNANSDIFSYTTQRPQPNNFVSSSHQDRNPEQHEIYNTSHSNSSRKQSTRSSKKRKQPPELIRTEFIPGHRGGLDVDELVMFIDGNPTTKQKQRNNSASIRSNDTNKSKSVSSLPDTNSNRSSTSRRKSRKTVKSTGNNENKTTITNDEDTQSIDFIDDDDDVATTAHSTDSVYNEEITSINPLPIDDESHSNNIDSTNYSNTTNGEISVPEWLEPAHSKSPVNDDTDVHSQSSAIQNNSNSEIQSDPFVTVTHRRRLIRERRQDNSVLLPRPNRLPSSPNINDKRHFQSSTSTQNGIVRPAIRNSLSNIKPSISNTSHKEEKTALSSPPLPPSIPAQTPVQTLSSPPPQSQPQLPTAPVPPTISNHVVEQSSPRLSSHSSSSSLPSLSKRQSKPPPVVFLNKSIDVELNDVSFGFDIEPSTTDKVVTPTPLSEAVEKQPETDVSSTASVQVNESSTNSKPYSRRPYQPRNNRGLLFYSGSDIRPQHHHRNYPPHASYFDPMLLLQYNQQRFATNYSQQLTYMNLLRAPYISSQPSYFLVPASYTTTSNDNEPEEKVFDDEPNSMSEQVQEPLLVYATAPTQTAPMYGHSMKKPYYEIEQVQPSSMPMIYPTQYFYPPQAQHVTPSHTAYFQPISSPSLNADTKSQHEDTDEEEDNDYEKSEKLYHQKQQQSSSHIMSNALQLVYSQERRNAQTDRFNLDQLTAYLAMKWADSISHYEQGDDEIILVGEQ